MRCKFVTMVCMIDVTRPGTKPQTGKSHIIPNTIRQIEQIFTRMGFEIAQANEVETEQYNFDALNVPEDHPARDMQDTFWIAGVEQTVLRTHTSNTQVRYMESHEPPIRIIAPGRVYRNESIDATHEAQFHQCEGLVVGETISLSNLKHVLLEFLTEFFDNPDTNIRFRPGYFPFVEPGVEVDVSCFRCGNQTGQECNVCKGSGWIEILGAGMVHPHTLAAGGIDADKYQGFAFGMGIERLVMLKYGVDDIRDFYDGDIPFISQF